MGTPMPSRADRPDANPYPALWVAAYLSPHGACGGWSIDSRDGAQVCACGAVIPEAERAAA